MEFCSNCGTRLVYNPRGKLQLYCSKCKKKFEKSGENISIDKSGSLTKSKKTENQGIVVLDKKTLKLRTLPRVDAECYKCNGKKAETWNLNIGSEDNSQATFFRCVSCGHTWRQTE